MRSIFVVAALVLCGLPPAVHAERDCSRLTEAEGRPLCELSKQGKLFDYTVRTRFPGNGSTLCETFAANLRAIKEPPNCQLRIHPKYAKDFQLPQWEELDPWQNLDLLWRAGVAVGAGVTDKREVDMLNRNAWLARYNAHLYKYDLTPSLRKAFFDITGDDDPEWVLAYGVKTQCNPWAYPTVRNADYFHYMLRSDDPSQMNEVGMSGTGPVPRQWGTLLRSRFLDANGNNTHTYILDGAWGVGYTNSDGNHPRVTSFRYLLYAVQYMGQPVGMHVCTFELRNTSK